MRKRPLVAFAFVAIIASAYACGGKPDASRFSDGNISASGGTASTSGATGGTTGNDGTPIIIGGTGQSCTSGDCSEPDPVCGDGLLQDSTEECDDKNTTSGDGCSATCTVEEGWICPIVAAQCRAAACGDGIRAGLELCDDGNLNSGDGCTETCRAEANYNCHTPGQLCEKTNCGNGIVEGTEACDDGNNYLGDGCSVFCQKEPSCAPPAPCGSSCGDGIKFGGEDCDDGNANDGDGCSSKCEVEAGWTCSETAGDDLVIPIVYRDFKAFQNGGHVDFQWSENDPIDRTPTQDIWVRTTLGTTADTTPDGTSLLGRPVFKWYAQCNGSGCTNITPKAGVTQPAGTLGAAQCNAVKNDGTGTRLITTDGRNVHYCGYGTKDFHAFSQWYLDVEGINRTIKDELRLTRGAGGVYRFDDNSFFPLDGLGFGNYASTNHNFHFTSEVRYWFEYNAAANATLTFDGDDDVWVFANGRLVVDISGTHSEIAASVTLNPTVKDIEGKPLNLIDGEVYEIVVFQAERNTNASNYRLSLDDFALVSSECESVCGDGIVTLDEACDDGVNDGSYGKCNPDCSRGPFCGDGTRQGAEECDDGNFKNGDGCSAACKFETVK